MSKRSVSYGSILGILLTVIVFVIIIIVSRNIITAANYAGRWECKFAYAIASPLGLFSQEAVVAQEFVKSGAAALAIAFTLITTATAIYAYYKTEKPTITIKVLEEIGPKEFVYKLKEEKVLISREIAKSTFMGVLNNQKYKGFLKYSLYPVGVLAGIYDLASISNSIAETMQRPILENLCKPKVDGYIDTADLDDEVNLKMCINDLKKEVFNNTKKEFIDDIINYAESGGYSREYYKNMTKQLCLLYVVAKSVVATYGETIGTSVKTGYSRLHYVLLVNYSLGKEIYLSDLLVVLDLMGINQNKSYYDVIYGEGVAYAKGEGDIYKKYKEKVGEKIKISDKGVTKIMTLYTFIDENGNIIEAIGNETWHNNVLFKSNGYYMVNFIYDGQGAILINTIATT